MLFANIAGSDIIVETYFRAFITEVPLDDSISPQKAFLRVLKKYGRKHSFLLESVFDSESTSLAKRFSNLSIICCEPLLAVQSKGRECRIEGDKAIVRDLREELFRHYGVKNEFFVLPEGKDALHFLESIMKGLKADTGASRFSFGPIGFCSYDAVRFFEKIPDTLPDKLKIPDTFYAVHKNAVIFDHANKRIQFVTHIREGEKSNLQEFAETVLKGKEFELSTEAIGGETLLSNTSQAEFAQMVEKAKEYVRKGDVFQTVLSRRLEVKTSRDPLSIYFDLRKINPSPYMFYLDCGGFHLLGASPEVHVRMEGKRIEMRPIAGTRGRGKDKQEEEKLAAELLANEKEKSEHVMLVDLCRNDIGRVAKFGSVKVNELFTIEKYSHVQHIVSHVTGKLAQGKNAFDAFRATFPAGTVSGAPKVRAMEVIEELEKEKRGPYAGTVGYFDLKGNMDHCITIRSILMKDGTAFVQAGAGIVLDSDAKGEWIETRRKANACIKAITGREVTE
ncbi:anthranilate synthase component I family protein [Candidatus Micrarchaeota archaeon]|nr:anthranilate synthase component I family protein [Candidatus Micrarchaeota archaeon]